MSGLKLNASKSEIFICGISADKIEEIHLVTGFKIGTLPVRYLGVPLVTRKLTTKDCKPLIDKVTARLSNWTALHLSYAGRLVLIQSIIYSITTFWCRHFYLSKRVLKRISQLCSRYFWKGNLNEHSGSRVSWEHVCTLKSEGGLGLKNLFEWNRACILHHATRVISKAESIWIDWLYCYVLNKEDFWCVNPCASSMSWTFRKILSFRQDFLQNLPSLHTAPKIYNIKSLWDITRVTYPKVDWHKVVWFPLHIPRHSTIAWMAVLDRLPTKARMASWGNINDVTCLLCGSGIETRDHLFLECSYSQHIWVWIMEACNLHRSCMSWDDELKWLIKRTRGKSLIVHILKLAWNSFIYHLWRERNMRLFEHRCCNPTSTLQDIMFSVQSRLNGRMVDTSDPCNLDLCRNWDLLYTA